MHKGGVRREEGICHDYSTPYTAGGEAKKGKGFVIDLISCPIRGAPSALSSSSANDPVTEPPPQKCRGTTPHVLHPRHGTRGV